MEVSELEPEPEPDSARGPDDAWRRGAGIRFLVMTYSSLHTGKQLLDSLGNKAVSEAAVATADILDEPEPEPKLAVPDTAVVCKHEPLGKFKSELEFMQSIDEFWKDETAELYVLQVNAATDAVHVPLAKSKLDERWAEYHKTAPAKPKHVCMMVHVDREPLVDAGDDDDGHQGSATWQFNFLSGWDQVTLDSVDCSSVNVQKVRDQHIHAALQDEMDIKEVLQQEISSCFYSIQYPPGRNAAEHLKNIVHNMTGDRSQKVIEGLKGRIVAWLAETAGVDRHAADWVQRLARCRRKLAEGTTLANAIIRHMRQQVRHPLAMLLFRLEELDTLRTFFTLQDASQLQNEWLRLIRDEDVTVIKGLVPGETRKLKRYNLHLKLQFPFSKYFFQRVEETWRERFDEHVNNLLQDNLPEQELDAEIDKLVPTYCDAITSTVPDMGSGMLFSDHIDMYFHDFCIQQKLGVGLPEADRIEIAHKMFQRHDKDYKTSPMRIHTCFWRHGEQIVREMRMTKAIAADIKDEAKRRAVVMDLLEGGAEQSQWRLLQGICQHFLDQVRSVSSQLQKWHTAVRKIALEDIPTSSRPPAFKVLRLCEDFVRLLCINHGQTQWPDMLPQMLALSTEPDMSDFLLSSDCVKAVWAKLLEMEGKSFANDDTAIHLAYRQFRLNFARTVLLETQSSDKNDQFKQILEQLLLHEGMAFDGMASSDMEPEPQMIDMTYLEPEPQPMGEDSAVEQLLLHEGMAFDGMASSDMEPEPQMLDMMYLEPEPQPMGEDSAVEQLMTEPAHKILEMEPESEPQPAMSMDTVLEPEPQPLVEEGVPLEPTIEQGSKDVGKEPQLLKFVTSVLATVLEAEDTKCRISASLTHSNVFFDVLLVDRLPTERLQILNECLEKAQAETGRTDAFAICAVLDVIEENFFQEVFIEGADEAEETIDPRTLLNCIACAETQLTRPSTLLQKVTALAFLRTLMQQLGACMLSDANVPSGEVMQAINGLMQRIDPGIEALCKYYLKCCRARGHSVTDLKQHCENEAGSMPWLARFQWVQGEHTLGLGVNPLMNSAVAVEAHAAVTTFIRNSDSTQLFDIVVKCDDVSRRGIEHRIGLLSAIATCFYIPWVDRELTQKEQDAKEVLLGELQRGDSSAHMGKLPVAYRKAMQCILDGNLTRMFGEDPFAASASNCDKFVGSVILHIMISAASMDIDQDLFAVYVASPQQVQDHFVLAAQSLEDTLFKALQEGSRDARITRYQCPCGFKYIVGECGQTMQLGNCPQCGEPIGGERHTALAGQVKVDHTPGVATDDKPGFIDSSAMVGDPVRGLLPPSACALDLLVHCCFGLSMGLCDPMKQRDVLRVFRGAQIHDPDQAVQHCRKHVRACFEHLGKLLGESTDEDTAIMLHSVIHHLPEFCRQQPRVLEIPHKRKEWEEDFQAELIQPHMLPSVAATVHEYREVSSQRSTLKFATNSCGVQHCCPFQVLLAVNEQMQTASITSVEMEIDELNKPSLEECKLYMCDPLPAVYPAVVSMKDCACRPRLLRVRAAKTLPSLRGHVLGSSIIMSQFPFLAMFFHREPELHLIQHLFPLIQWTNLVCDLRDLIV
jgi:hypothetical protein